MGDQSIISALLLGIIEGLTEFIPVSSTAHVLLAGHFLGFKSPGNTFAVLIQLGAILAILLVYFQKLAFAPLPQQNSIGKRGGAIVIHQPGVRQFHTKRVINDVADGGPVAGAGKTMGETPILQRIGDGTPASLNIRQYFDCSGQTPAQTHCLPLLADKPGW